MIVLCDFKCLKDECKIGCVVFREYPRLIKPYKPDNMSKTYTIISYSELLNTHYIKDENGDRFYVDLCVDATWKEYLDLGDNPSSMEIEKLCKSVVGKKIVIGKLLSHLYVGCNSNIVL